jgi:TonB family protein
MENNSIILKAYKMKNVLIILPILLLSSCENNIRENSILNYSDNAIETDENNVPLDSTQTYFPLEFFPNTSHDSTAVRHYSKHLFSMKEPLLFNKIDSKETYRFTWLRTFENSVSIRIEKTLEEYKLYWKLTDGAGGYNPGNIIVSESKAIDKRTWRTFKNHIKKSQFWEMSTVESNNDGLDGSHWILEGNDQFGYHVVLRWCPRGAFYDCCKFLINQISIDSATITLPVISKDTFMIKDYGKVYIIVDQQPTFNSQLDDLNKYIFENISFYANSKKEKLSGTVFISFVVFEDGSLNDIKIIRGLGDDIDSELLNLFMKMPKWEPGIYKDKQVKTQVTMPIRFEK